MKSKRAKIFDTKATLRSYVALGGQDNLPEQMQQYAHLFRPVLTWLAERSKELQESEDVIGEFRDDCESRLHVRAMKGARMDCDDIRQELEAILTPS